MDCEPGEFTSPREARTVRRGWRRRGSLHGWRSDPARLLINNMDLKIIGIFRNEKGKRKKSYLGEKTAK